jgi:hypothetical protein
MKNSRTIMPNNLKRAGGSWTGTLAQTGFAAATKNLQNIS